MEEFVRFMRLVEIGHEKGSCWIWRGNRPSGKYGHFAVTVDGEHKSVKAHRWMYEHVNGPIPDGMLVRHKCDNPPCCNPKHLEVGTHKDNAQDKVSRGRYANRQGERHPLAKLNAERVLEIRRRASCGEAHGKLSAEFGVRRGQIGKIVNRINWSHI